MSWKKVTRNFSVKFTEISFHTKIQRNETCEIENSFLFAQYIAPYFLQTFVTV